MDVVVSSDLISSQCSVVHYDGSYVSKEGVSNVCITTTIPLDTNTKWCGRVEVRHQSGCDIVVGYRGNFSIHIQS